MKKLFLLAVLPVFALAGCNGISKTDYAKFKEKAEKAAEKAKEVDFVTYKGKFDGKDYEFKSNDSSLSAEERDLKTALGAFDNVKAFTVEENKECTYYTGLGFKVVYSDIKLEYSGKGLLTHAEGQFNSKELKFSVKHTFKK